MSRAGAEFFPKAGMIGWVWLALTGCLRVESPVWSPGREALVYPHYRCAEDGSLRSDLYYADFTGGAAELALIEKGATGAVFAPDGVSVLYLAGQEKRDGPYTKLRLFAPENEPEAVKCSDLLVHGAGFHSVQYSPEGSLLLLARYENAGPRPPVTLTKYDLTAKRETPLEPKWPAGHDRGEIRDPALSPDGSLIAFTWSFTSQGERVSVLGLFAPATPEPRMILSMADQKAKIGLFDEYWIRWLPDQPRRLVFYAPAGGKMWSTDPTGRAVRAYPIPESLGRLVGLEVALEGGTPYAVGTFLAVAGGRPSFSVQKLDLNAGREWVAAGEASGALIGPPVRSASGRFAAFHSPGGLALVDLRAARQEPHLHPVGLEQLLYAARAAITRKESAQALEMLDRAEKLPEHDSAELLELRVRAQLAAGQPGEAVGPMLKLLLYYPLRRKPLPLGETVQMLTTLLAAQPDDKMLEQLRAAFLREQKGDLRGALAVLEGSYKYAGDRLSAAGIYFRAGELLFRLGEGEHPLAADRFDSAARTLGFPQADYAAGLAAIAALADGRPQYHHQALGYARKATADFANSPLAQDLKLLAREVTTPFNLQTPPTKQVTAAGASAWLEKKPLLRYHAAIDPVWCCVEGTPQARRLWFERGFEVQLAAAGVPDTPGKVQRLLTAPVDLALLCISPDGRRAAFTAEADVFPLGKRPGAIFVVELASGKVLHGEATALAAGKLASRVEITALQFESNTALAVSGKEYDPLGGARDYQKKLALE